MVELILTHEQAAVFREAMENTIQVRDPEGKVLTEIAPQWNREFIAELKRRVASPGPWYTTAQVQARLKALQEEWDRTGGFDQAHMEALMARLNQEDPGHYRQPKGVPGPGKYTGHRTR